MVFWSLPLLQRYAMGWMEERAHMICGWRPMSWTGLGGAQQRKRRPHTWEAEGGSLRRDLDLIDAQHLKTGIECPCSLSLALTGKVIAVTQLGRRDFTYEKKRRGHSGRHFCQIPRPSADWLGDFTTREGERSRRGGKKFWTRFGRKMSANVFPDE